MKSIGEHTARTEGTPRSRENNSAGKCFSVFTSIFDIPLFDIRYSLLLPVLLALSLLILIASPRQAFAGMFDVSERKEIEIGKQTADMLAEEYGLVENPTMVERIEKIGASITEVSDRSNLEYHFGVLDTEIINALALPGGYIFVTKGLMKLVSDDDELASVVAHEVVHIAKKHSVVGYKKSMKSMMYSLIVVLLSQDPGVAIASDMYNQSRMELYGRKAEVEADTVGLKYAADAGYDPAGALRFFDKMLIEEMKRPNMFEDFYMTHPPTPERIKTGERIVGEMGRDPKAGRGYRIRARVYADEVCDEEEKNCLAVLRGGDIKLARLADSSVFKTPYNRARVVEKRLNEILEKGVELYQLRVRETGGHTGIWGGNTLILEILAEDFAASGAASRGELADQWLANLRKFLWHDYVSERLR